MNEKEIEIYKDKEIKNMNIFLQQNKNYYKNKNCFKNKKKNMRLQMIKIIIFNKIIVQIYWLICVE